MTSIKWKPLETPVSCSVKTEVLADARLTEKHTCKGVVDAKNLINSHDCHVLSLDPRPKTNPSVDHFQYRAWGILEAIHTPDEVRGQD